MKIHELLIIPGAGHAGINSYDRGRITDNYAEVDLVDRYVETMIEELDQSLIRYRVVNTRKAPGTPLKERLKESHPHCLPVFCSVGWNDSKKIRAINNVSVVTSAPQVPIKITAGIADILGHWGRLYVHGHKASPAVDPDIEGVRIEPFQLNGRHAAEYITHLGKLGRDVGRFLADYCRSKQEGAAIQFSQPPQRQGRII